MSTWSTSIPQIQDGDQVNAASVNNLINYLAGREQYLKDQLDNYSDKTLIISYNQPINVGSSGMLAGTPLYFNNNSGSSSILYPAICGYGQSNNPGHLTPNDSAYVFGISADVYSGTTPGVNYGDVYVYGLVSGISFASLMDESSYTCNEPPPGPLYLSTLTAGKFSTTPTGASVYIGYIVSNDGGTPATSTIFLSPNVDSLNQLYFNYQVWLNTAAQVTTPLTAYGWISSALATSTYGVTPPTIASTTAAYYYSTPQTLTLTTDSVNSTNVLSGSSSANVADGDTVTIGTITYRFKNTMSAINDVQITGSGNTDGSLGNLILAILGAGTAGTTAGGANYYTGTIANTSATANSLNNHSFTITSNISGVTLITVAVSSTVLSWGAGLAGVIGLNFTADQINNTLKYKAAMPPYPGAYTQLFVNGVLQTQASAQFPNGTYVVNEDGLWWMSSVSGYQPFGLDINSNPITMQLLVTKLNPNYADSIVTSLTSSDQTITLTDAASGQTSSTGSLIVGFNPSFSYSSGGNTGTGVQSIGYNESAQSFELITAPVINTIIPGAGLTAATTSGATTLSLTSALSGEVVDIEPEEADYVYKGLHSYLRLRKPVINQTIGFVGKLLLPQVIPAGANFNVSLLAFAENTALAEIVTCNFDYCISAAGSIISSAITSNAVSIPFTALNVANTVALVTASSTNGGFQVPNSVLIPGAYVNFRISRTNLVSSAAPALGVLGVMWTLA